MSQSRFNDLLVRNYGNPTAGPISTRPSDLVRPYGNPTAGGFGVTAPRPELVRPSAGPSHFTGSATAGVGRALELKGQLRPSLIRPSAGPSHFAGSPTASTMPTAGPSHFAGSATAQSNPSAGVVSLLDRIRGGQADLGDFFTAGSEIAGAAAGLVSAFTDTGEGNSSAYEDAVANAAFNGSVGHPTSYVSPAGYTHVNNPVVSNAPGGISLLMAGGIGIAAIAAIFLLKG